MTAVWAAVGLPLPLDPGEQGGVEGVALGAVASLPRAFPLQFFTGWLLHGDGATRV